MDLVYSNSVSVYEHYLVFGGKPAKNYPEALAEGSRLS